MGSSGLAPGGAEGRRRGEAVGRFGEAVGRGGGCTAGGSSLAEGGVEGGWACMAGGNRLVLEECKRNDSDVFSFYTRLIPGGDLFGRMAEAVALAKERYRYEGICELNLVLSHRKRWS